MSIWHKLEQKISISTGHPFHIKKQVAISGGSINKAYRLEGVDEKKASCHYFLKLNQESMLEMFEMEASGLNEIEQTGSIRVPHVICSGVIENQSYLILENLDLVGNISAAEMSAVKLGQQLALMHKQTSDLFGWSRNNTIGSTAQINNQTETWLEFWREHRLGFQLHLAKKNGVSRSLKEKGERLLKNLELFFVGYQPNASLLHGDLWSGNYGYLNNGEPVIFDPAVYYGDRETDIAMTELFGGYPERFYTAYNDAWPLDEGYQQRKILYNLYHILNHFNLFGGGYALQAENMIIQLLTKL